MGEGLSDLEPENLANAPSPDRLARRPGYLLAHWRGAHSLARSYWVNGALVTVLLALLIVILDRAAEASSLATRGLLIYSLVVLAFSALVGVWQIVGLWRSAGRTWSETGRLFWPAVVILLTVVGAINGAIYVGTAARDLVALVRSLDDPVVTDYLVERTGEDHLWMSGALNDDSVRDVIALLEDPAITLLRIDSHGGLIGPATRLARYVRDHEITVLAETMCISACVLVLAGSPRGSVYLDSEVTFHKAQAPVELTNRDYRLESERFLAQFKKLYEEFGVAAWGPGLAGLEEYWTPTLDQLVRMNLVDAVYLPELGDFVPAAELCAERPGDCS